MSSLVVRQSIGRQLRVLREAAGIAPAEVALARICSRSKLYRLERGDNSVRLETVWALCDLYRATPEQKSRLSEMALNSAENGWWESFADLMAPRFGTYIELESAASRLLLWEGELVHGLLQTPDYHRAVFAVDPDGTPEAEARYITLRVERQRAAFERNPPLQVSAVIGEGALKRQVGGRGVMHQQCVHLLTLARLPNIEIRVLTWNIGAHAATQGAFSILRFDPEVSPDVVYLQTYAGGRYEDDVKRVPGYIELHRGLQAVATPIEEYLK